jgi:hypothetical protein
MKDATCAIAGHIPIDGTAISSMFLRTNRNGRRVLYLAGPSRRALLAVDVSAPAHPIELEPIRYPANAVAGMNTTLGTDTLLVDAATNESAGLTTARTVSLLDLSAPGSLSICLQFKNVTTYLMDDSHDLLYIANDRGLWIVHYKGLPDAGSKIWEQSFESR